MNCNQNSNPSLNKSINLFPLKRQKAFNNHLNHDLLEKYKSNSSQSKNLKSKTKLNQSHKYNQRLTNPHLISENGVEQTDNRVFSVFTEDEKTQIIDTQFEIMQKKFMKPDNEDKQ